MTDLSGHCFCGDVTWSYSGPRLRNLVCHCSDCQRANAAPFSAFVGCRPEGVVWHGPVSHFESAPGTHRGFCARCGTRLYFRSDRWPGEIHLQANTLDDPARYQPDRHVVWESHLGWLEDLADLPRDGGFARDPQGDDL